MVAVNMSANVVVVAIDGEKDYTGASMEYATHYNNVRPVQETAAEKQTLAAKRAADDCRTRPRPQGRPEAQEVSRHAGGRG